MQSRTVCILHTISLLDMQCRETFTNSQIALKYSNCLDTTCHRSQCLSLPWKADDALRYLSHPPPINPKV